MSAGCVVVVGLGPGDTTLLTAGAREAIERHPVRFLRTCHHPAASAVPEAHTFDEAYERATTLEGVYEEIAASLTAAATEHGTVLYAVPGSPLVAERSVELLLSASAAGVGPEVELVPAMSFLDLAWVRLGVDPVATGARVIDGHRFETEANGTRGALLVAQCDRADVLSEVKLAVGDAIDRRGGGPDGAPAEDPEVIVLHRLGTADEEVVAVAWHELDRVVPDHLTSVWVPPLSSPMAGEMQRFVDLVALLRRECPWDRDQTHASLRRHLLEETYEVLEALDGVDPQSGVGYEELQEELGDLLFQVVFHATLGAEAGQFTLAEVARGIHDKLYERHPHVFGDVVAEEAADVVAGWEQRKKAEKGRESVFDGIPVGLPALAFALKVHKKAATLGEEQRAGVPPVPDPTEALRQLSQLDDTSHGATDTDGGDGADELIGALLLGLVDVARRHGVDPEGALRVAAAARRDAVRSAEVAATASGQQRR